jgi:transposase
VVSSGLLLAAANADEWSMICVCGHMLATGELYRDLGSDYVRQRDPERATKHLVRRLEALGHRVTLEQPVAA